MKGDACKIFVIVNLLLTVASPIVSAADMELLRTHPEVGAFFYQIWLDSSLGRDFNEREVAIWIIRRNDGYVCRKWPTSNSRRQQVWDRYKPYGAVAIAHTHPVTVDPKPSKADRFLAMKLEMPIYTISAQVWRVNPDGAISREDGIGWHHGVDREAPIQCK